MTDVESYPEPSNVRRSEQLGSAVLYLDWNKGSIVDSPGYALMQEIQLEHPKLEIREEQVDCLDAMQLARVEGHDKVLVQMATGLGKTTVVAADVKRFLSDKPGARVLLLCHQNRILDQDRERFEDIVGPDYTYGNFTGESQDYHEVTCLFASFQAMNGWKEAFLPGEFDYVVVDESHHSMAETYRPTVEYFKPEFLLGVTGTPDRHDMRDIREIFGPERYKKTLEEAIAEDRLTHTDYSVIIDEIAAQQKLQDDNGERFNFRQLNRDIFVPMRDEEMARICKEKAEEMNVPTRRLVFCSSVEQTEEFAQYFENAAPVHTKLPPLEIKESLEKFRNGEIETLLTVDMFNEGIDVPEINQVVFLRLTQSKTIFLQQLGRGLRKVASKDTVQVLDFVANADRLLMLDRFWKRIRDHKPTDPETPETFRINISENNFTETLRDVLEILADIEADNNIYRSLKGEGWMSINQISEVFNMTPYLSSRAIQEIGLSGRKLRPANSREFTYYSPDQVVEIKEWVEKNYPDPPENYLSFAELTDALELSEAKLERIIGQMSIVPDLFRSPLSGRLMPYFSVEQGLQIIDHPHLSLEIAPEGYINKNQASQNLGVSFKYLTQILEQIGIEPSTYLTPLHYPGSFLSGEQMERVSNFFNERQSAPEGFTSYSQVVNDFSMAESSIERICRELNITPRLHKNKRGHTTRFLAPDEVDQIAAHPYSKLEYAPEGFSSVGDIEDVVGLSDTTILDIARNLGLEWASYKNPRGMITRYLSPQQIDIFLKHPLVNVEVAPEEYLSHGILFKEMGIAHTTLTKIREELGIEPYKYKVPSSGQIRDYYSPEQVEQMKQHPFAQLELAPQGYMTIEGRSSGIMKLYGVTRHQVIQAVASLGLTPHNYKNPSGGKVQRYYSPDQIGLILGVIGSTS